MGNRDVAEQLEAAIEEVGKLEREVATLRAEKDSPHADAKYWAELQEARLELTKATAERDASRAVNADLLQSLTELQPAEVLVEGSYFPVGDLPVILGNFMRSNVELTAEVKGWYALSGLLMAERDAALAAIADAAAWIPEEPTFESHESKERALRSVRSALAQSPADALAKHDRAVKAEALDEAANAIGDLLTLGPITTRGRAICDAQDAVLALHRKVTT